MASELQVGKLGLNKSASHTLDIDGDVNIDASHKLRWGGGNAEIIGDGSYNLDFKTYDGTATTTKLKITSTGAATFEKSDGAIVNLYRNDPAILDGNTFGRLQALSGDDHHTAGTEVGSIVFKAYGDQTGTRPKGQIRFQIASNSTQSEAMRIEPDKKVKFFGGIAFDQTNTSATGAATDTNGTILEHYEEGTWTPVYSAGASSSGTWDTTLAGEFTRIGNLVTASMKITGTSMDFSSAGGYRTYSGLPFTGTLKGAGAVSTAHAASFSGTTSTNVGTNMTIIPAETGSGTSVVLAQATYRV